MISSVFANLYVGTKSLCRGQSKRDSKQSGAHPGFGQGGAQVLRPKVADIAKWSCASKASKLRPGSRACLRALEAFGFLMLKYAFSHILETLFL